MKLAAGLWDEEEMVMNVFIWMISEALMTCSMWQREYEGVDTDSQTRADKWTNGPDIPTLVGTEIQPWLDSTIINIYGLEIDGWNLKAHAFQEFILNWNRIYFGKAENWIPRHFSNSFIM